MPARRAGRLHGRRRRPQRRHFAAKVLAQGLPGSVLSSSIPHGRRSSGWPPVWPAPSRSSRALARHRRRRRADLRGGGCAGRRALTARACGAEALGRRAAGRRRARADVTREDEVDALFAAALETLRAHRQLRGERGRVDRAAGARRRDDARAVSGARSTSTCRVFLTCRAFLRVVGPPGQWRAGPRRLDRRPGRRGGARRLRGGEVGGHGGLLLSLKNEIVRVAPDWPRERRRARWTATGWRGRAGGARRPRTRVHPHDGAAQGRDARGRGGQIVLLASDRLSGHVTGRS
jgi:hypothetical protein